MFEDLLVLAAIAGIAAGLHKVENASEKAKHLRERFPHGRLRIVALAAAVGCHPVTIKTIEGYALHVVEIIVVRR
jgi:hypothetical protein